MTDEQIKPKRKRQPQPPKPARAYKTLNLAEPELFARLMAAVAKRKLGRMSLSGAARMAIEQWIAGN